MGRVGLGVGVGGCGEGAALPWALCQDSGPAITGSGLFNGPYSYVSSVTVTSQQTITIPVATVTTTQTQFYKPGCFRSN
jgi:hypothetical protein